MFTKSCKWLVMRLGMILVLLGGMLGTTPAKPVLASTITVTNTNDSGAGSLRQTIADATSGNTITFDSSLAGQTIMLASNLIFDKDVTIDGSGLSSQVTISGGSVAHLEIAANTSVTISDLTIANGYTNIGGGAIRSGGFLTIVNSTLRNNYSSDDCGAIESNGSLTIRNTTIYQNQAAGHGGAICIANDLYDNIIVNSTITQNQAGTFGGAIFLYGNGEGLIFNSTLAKNNATSFGSEIFIGGVGYLGVYNTAFACSTDTIDACISFDLADLVNSIVDTGTLADFGLAELADNGGPTQTMALLEGSFLIDAGDDTICANSLINNLDQRGVARPQGGHCDIGAYEYNQILYVKWNATGANDGTSWEDAYTDLQSALSAASSGDEVWVAAGTYYPTSGTDRDVLFELKNNVAIYGGFAGDEASRDERDWSMNVTTLSGDIGTQIKSDNSYHVVTGSGTNSMAVLDGFIVAAGNADTTNGGGMYNINGSPTLANITFWSNRAVNGGGMYNTSGSRPTLANVIFEGNEASSLGGGMFNGGSSPTLTNVAFISNSAASSGGGMVNQSNSSPTLTNVTFKGNSAPTWGGGMFNTANSNPTLTNVTFHLNLTSNSGAGIYNKDSSPTLTNVTFKENIAAMYGGGMANINSNPLIRNTILWGNTAPTGSQIYNSSSAPTIANSVVQESGGSGSFWVTRLGTDDGGNLDAEPLLGPWQDNSGFTQTMALSAGSAAIDAGDGTHCPGTDQRGVARPQGAGCDIGAYEFQPTSIVRYVKWDADGENNGTSWVDAYTDLQSALAAASSSDEIWVAAGIYKPTTGTDRTKSFSLKNGVVVYGGFAGTETEFAQRDFKMNLTVLSGDIGASGNNSDNSYHVVIGSDTNNSAVLDGFTVTRGNANGDSYPLDQSTGGGMYSSKGSPIIMNVTFSENSATFGGGMYNGASCPTCSAPGSNPTVRNVKFHTNSATMDGGGMLNEAHSHPILANVIFSDNTAIRAGGGLQNIYESSPTLTNVTFSGNVASAGGGIANWDYSSPTLTNVTFHANVATSTGGGMDIGNGSWPVLNNVTMSGNQADQGGGIYNNAPRTTINNSILYGNTGGEIYNAGGVVNVTYSIVLGGYSGTGNLDVNPLLGPLQNNGGHTQTMALGAGSPAINAGKIDTGYNGNCPVIDQRGVPRPQYGSCDIGAYEFAPTVELTVTADDQTIVYGSGDPTFAFTYSGFQSGDNETDIETPPTCSVSGAHSDVGTYPITCTGAVDSDGLYVFTYVSGSLTVNQATPTLSVTNSPASYNGSAQSADVIGSVAGTVSNIRYDGSATAPVDPGTYAVIADFTPDDTTNYTSLTDASAGNLVIESGPTVTLKSIGAQDGWILESSETSNQGGMLNDAATVLYVGDNAQDKQYRSFISFDTSSLPDDAVITSVQLKIRVQGFVGDNMFTPAKTHGNLLMDIRNPYYGTNVNLAVEDFQSASSKNNVGVLTSAPTTGWYTVTLKDTSYPFIDLEGTTQFRLRFQTDDNNDNGADYLKIYSGNAPVASRPQLIIEYYVP